MGTEPSTDESIHRECRSCGLNLDPEMEQCPSCGAGVAAYDLG